jgi:hypothetical protein
MTRAGEGLRTGLRVELWYDVEARGKDGRWLVGVCEGDDCEPHGSYDRTDYASAHAECVTLARALGVIALRILWGGRDVEVLWRPDHA